jgi:alanine-glyoxylate transaminase/serine-glyoxylate transaminase/serine-pyruvate transaminase
MADAIGAKVETMDFGLQAPVDLARLADRLNADNTHQIKAVMMVHVDTGTSLRNDVKGVREALDTVNHPALLMVDCIASLGCDRFDMDAWGVDVMVTASQKGLMTPPGLGFVFFNDRADAVRGQMKRVSRYWDWHPRAHPQIFSHRWNGTAPTHHLFALREALDMVAEEGLEAIWQRHENLAQMYWAAFDAWGAGDGVLQMNVSRPEWRSHAVTALRMPAPKATELRRWTEHKAGVTLGIGLGLVPADDPAWHGLFRVGHMGHVNAHMVMGVIGTIDAGLKALGIAHGPGATEAAAQIAASVA